MNGKCMIWQARNRALALFEEGGAVAQALHNIKTATFCIEHPNANRAEVEYALSLQDQCFKELMKAGCLTND